MSSSLLRRSLLTRPTTLPVLSTHPTTIRQFSHTPTPQLSKIQLIGRLADKPEMQTASTGTEMVKYAVGSIAGKGENAKTSWFRITAFLPEGGLRDLMLGLGKGSLVYVEGDVTMRSYEDADGKSRTAFNIVQRNIDVLTAKRDTAQEGQSSESEGN